MNVNPEFEFEILINKGKYRGQSTFLDLTLDDLLEMDISDYLIDGGYLEYYCNDGEYTILNKKLIR